MRAGAAVVMALGCAYASPGFCDPPVEVMNIVREGEIRWVQNPAIPGAAAAVLSGNPAIPGQPYVQRVRFSPGTFSPPHFHPETRYIVVIKGTWWVGAGPSTARATCTPRRSASAAACRSSS